MPVDVDNDDDDDTAIDSSLAATSFSMANKSAVVVVKASLEFVVALTGWTFPVLENVADDDDGDGNDNGDDDDGDIVDDNKSLAVAEIVGKWCVKAKMYIQTRRLRNMLCIFFFVLFFVFHFFIFGFSALVETFRLYLKCNSRIH